MKKITLLLFLSVGMIVYGQNLLTNGDFETEDMSGWGGFNQQNLLDQLTNSRVGNANNAEASIFQVVTLTPGETYRVTFDYRWVSGTGNYNLTVRVKDDLASGKPNLNITGGTSADGYKFSTTPDQWFTNNTFTFTVPTGVTDVRLLFYKGNGNRPYRIDNVVLEVESTASLVDLAKLGFKPGANPVMNEINFNSNKSIDKVEVFNLLGQRVLSRENIKPGSGIDASNLKQGIYIVQVSIEGRLGNYKIIKN